MAAYRWLAALLLVVATSAQAPNDANGVASINISTYGGGIGHWCLYAAEDEGYLDQAHVKIGNHLTIFGDPNIISSLLSGDVDIALGSAGTIVPVANGQTDQIVVIAETEAFPVSLVAPEAITSVAQLAGKTIAMQPRNASPSILGGELIDRLVGKGKWTPLYLGGPDSAHVALVGAGRADAAMVNDPVTLDPALHLHLVARLTSRPAFVNGPALATKRFLQSRPDVAVRFLAAFSKGCDFLLDPKNRAAAIGFLVNDSHVSPEAATGAYDYYVAGPARGQVPPRDARIDMAGFSKAVEQLKAGGSITNKAFDPASVVDTSYLERGIKMAASFK